MSYETEERLSAAMRNAVGDRPFTPNFDQIETRGRKLKGRRLAWRATAGTGFAVAAIAAVAVATTGSGTQAPVQQAAPKTGVTSGVAETPLVHLVGYLTTAPQPSGDATLLLRDQPQDNGKAIDVWDLHADNGDYYFAKTKSALPEQVAGKHVREDKAGRQNVVAAAKLAATGDLNTAREKMALAYEPAHPKVAPTLQAPGAESTLDPATKKKLEILHETWAPTNTTDNWVWENSIDALITGAGSPTVRAGVLKLVGQMPEVKVEKSTLDGQPVLNLTAGNLATGNGDETITVNADSGLPIKFASNGKTFINYTVTRVTLADVAAGKF